MCGVSRSGYYAWKDRPVSQRARANERLKEMIEQIFCDSHGTYGSPRVHAELQAQGVRCGRRRVARLMREQGLVARSKRIYHPNQARRDLYGMLPNLLLDQPLPTVINQHWVSDTTCFRVRGKWLHLAVILDRYSRQVVGWSIGESRDSELVCAALRMALNWRRIEGELIFHSDQGIEYASNAFRALLAESGITQSMSRAGNPYDNAHMESFFKSLKAEVIHGRRFGYKAEAVAYVIDYINFYNYERRHSSLGYMSPMNYEQSEGV
jgi:putative transposase